MIILFCLTLLLLGCDANPAMASATAQAALPAFERALQPIATTTPVPDPAVVNADCPEVTRHRHTVVADIDYTNRTVDVQQRIQYSHPEALQQVVVNIEANRWANTFFLNRVAQGTTDLPYTLESKRLTIDLPEAVAPNCVVEFWLDYRLVMPRVGLTINAAKGYFGFTERQMNLGHWLATVAPFRAGAWISREAFLIGEQEVLEQADWSVTLNLVGGAQNITIAAPGIVTEISPTSRRFVLNAARDFPASLSDQFVVNTATTDAGTVLELYTFAQDAAAEQAFYTATRSLEQYSRLFGALPYTRVLVVQGDFPDGMELSALVFVGDGWFTRYPNNPASYLTLITAHEVSHQWWYARVGNDAAMTPWLDEALATYSEYLFIEEYYPDLREWWWNFRVDSFGPVGFVDSTVYDFSDFRTYINAVYLRGVRMLHALREDIGAEAFFVLLAEYAAAGDGTIATPALFWSLLNPEQQALSAETRAAFLRHPELSEEE
ncbi:MAG: hypothetical protein OHK0046_00830 [Anaerolineae bacterium]